MAIKNLTKEDMLKLQKIVKEYKEVKNDLIRSGGGFFSSEEYFLAREMEDIVGINIAESMKVLIREELYSEFYTEIKDKCSKSLPLSSEEKEFLKFIEIVENEENKVKEVWNKKFGFKSRFEQDMNEKYLKARNILQFGLYNLGETRESALQSLGICDSQTAKAIVEKYDREKLESLVLCYYNKINSNITDMNTIVNDASKATQEWECFDRKNDSAALIFTNQKATKIYEALKQLDKIVKQETTKEK